MGPIIPRVITVRNGVVQPSGSWLYVWIDTGSGDIVHVGGTPFDPELRAHLHVVSTDPRIGRVRAAVPRYDERSFDVLAFELSDDVDRSAAKRALVARLAPADEDAVDAEAASDLHGVIDPIVQAIDRHRRT